VKRQRGAALLAVFAVLVALSAAAAVVTFRDASKPESRDIAERRVLALARDALWGYAQAQYCRNPAQPLETLLPCPDAAATEGLAAPSCPGTTRGWLPWRSLQLPPLRDASGTCLWVERSGVTVRVIAPGGARPGQNRAADPARTICGGNLVAANYLDVTDASLTLTLQPAALAAVCP
jgi:hypothetical protein